VGEIATPAPPAITEDSAALRFSGTRDARSAARLAQDVSVEPLLLDARQAAALYGVSRATWHRMVSAGSVPASFRPSPGCVRWRTEELRAHIAAGMPDRKEWEVLQTVQRNGRG
jgi:predicted DNA-binding transcriptional regulator AlpA